MLDARSLSLIPNPLTLNPNPSTPPRLPSASTVDPLKKTVHPIIHIHLLFYLLPFVRLNRQN